MSEGCVKFYCFDFVKKFIPNKGCIKLILEHLNWQRDLAKWKNLYKLIGWASEASNHFLLKGNEKKLFVYVWVYDRGSDQTDPDRF